MATPLVGFVCAQLRQNHTAYARNTRTCPARPPGKATPERSNFAMR
jgi:hypothetical protein